MNGDPVLFAALGRKDTIYSFACTSCGRHLADQPDSVCRGCTKPKPKTARRPARKTTPVKR